MALQINYIQKHQDRKDASWFLYIDRQYSHFDGRCGHKIQEEHVWSASQFWPKQFCPIVHPHLLQKYFDPHIFLWGNCHSSNGQFWPSKHYSGKNNFRKIVFPVFIPGLPSEKIIRIEKPFQPENIRGSNFFNGGKEIHLHHRKWVVHPSPTGKQFV